MFGPFSRFRMDSLMLFYFSRFRYFAFQILLFFVPSFNRKIMGTERPNEINYFFTTFRKITQILLPFYLHNYKEQIFFDHCQQLDELLSLRNDLFLNKCLYE